MRISGLDIDKSRRVGRTRSRTRALDGRDDDRADSLVDSPSVNSLDPWREYTCSRWYLTYSPDGRDYLGPFGKLVNEGEGWITCRSTIKSPSHGDISNQFEDQHLKGLAPNRAFTWGKRCSPRGHIGDKRVFEWETNEHGINPPCGRSSFGFRFWAEAGIDYWYSNVNPFLEPRWFSIPSSDCTEQEKSSCPLWTRNRLSSAWLCVRTLIWNFTPSSAQYLVGRYRYL